MIMRNQVAMLTGILAVIASALPIAAQSAPPPYGNEQYSSNQPVDQGVAPNQVDPEDRNHGVARVSLLNGDVSVRRGDSGDFVAAALNAPLLTLDAVQTGPSSRAEIQFDTANRLRFANDTEARFSQLTGDRAQIQLARGTVTWAVLADGGMQGEIATPSVAVRPLGRGDYRISVLPDGRTEITARSGTLEVYSPRGVERIQAGQTMLAQGGVDNPEFQTLTAVAPDEWDIFNERRDRELQGSRSYNYVSRDIAGAEDLDNYGQWNTDSMYGQVWTPRVASDWAPYRLGRWSYEDYYGWTWVSGDPWGWAPYHYGSWFQSSYGWSWCPGPRYSHNYYRPALVAFFGYGSGGGYGGRGWGFGNVGWVPLAPFERYHPWYGRGGGSGYGGGFGRGVKIVNNVNITNSYRNARANNGVTSMNSRDFAGGNFGRYSSPGMSQLQQAGAVHGAMPFTPSANHYRFNDRQTALQPRTNFNQTQFANRTQSSGTAQGGNRYVPQQQGVGSFGRQGSIPANQGNQQYGGSSNWNRFGTPSSSSGQMPQQQNGGFGRQQQPAVNQTPTATQGNNSWQRFGDPGSNRQNYAPQRSNSSMGDYRPMTQQPQFGRNNSPAVQVAPPVVRERNVGSQPNYSRPNYSQPNYSQPTRSQPSYSQPSYGQPQQNMSRPAYSQPRTDSQPQSQPSRQNSVQHQDSRPSSSSGSGNHDNGSHGRR